MACERNLSRTAKAARGSGIPYTSSKSSHTTALTGVVDFYFPQNKPGAPTTPLPWPPPSRPVGLSSWGDYRARIRTALKNWRSQGDDRALARLRADLAYDLFKQVSATPKNGHPAGIAGQLAEERAGLLLSPPKSLSPAERVERVAVLDNTLALLRLKQLISEDQYRFAVVQMVAQQRNLLQRSVLPITWMPGRPAGIEEYSSSQVDPNRKVAVRYRVVDLDEPIASNTVTGEINPHYDQELQPRRRDRAGYQLQIENLARNLEAASLLQLEASWSEGPPIVGPDGMVESGNGRLLALRLAAEINPAGYRAYRQALQARAFEYGLNPSDLNKIKRPVVVRERVTEFSRQARKQFVNEANVSGATRMGVAEQARADAQLIPPGFFAGLQVAESDNSLADVLSKKANGPVIARFASLLPHTEKAALADRQGNLSAEGVNRLERAMFAYALPGASGERLAQLVFEGGEAIDRVGAGLKQSLPKLGQMEDLIKAGQRRGDLSLGEDLAVAVQKMRDLRRQGLSVNDYLRQYTLFAEMTPFQKQLLVQLDGRRHSAKSVSKLIGTYADKVVAQTAPPQQQGMFGQESFASREALLRAAVQEIGGDWVNIENWTTAQRAVSGLDVPAVRVEKLTTRQQARGMRKATATAV